MRRPRSRPPALRTENRGNELTADRAAELLTEACAAVDMDPAAARLLRLGSNAVYRLAASVVVRISRQGADVEHVRRTVAVARRSAHRGRGQLPRCWTCPSPCAMPPCPRGSTPESSRPRSRSGPGTAWPCSYASTPSASPASKARQCGASSTPPRTTRPSPRCRKTHGTTLQVRRSLISRNTGLQCPQWNRGPDTA
jgi:hypothetical protein